MVRLDVPETLRGERSFVFAVLAVQSSFGCSFVCSKCWDHMSDTNVHLFCAPASKFSAVHSSLHFDFCVDKFTCGTFKLFTAT